MDDGLVSSMTKETTIMNSTRTRRVATFATAVAAAACLSVTLAVPAHAATSDDEAYTRSFLTEYGVPTTTQDALVDKLSHGQTLDSAKSGAIPVSSRTITTATADEVVSTFADGSISVSGTEQAAPAASGSIAPRAIKGCKESNGGGYVVMSGCTVYLQTASYELSFKATYERYTGGAQIDSAPSSSLYVNAFWGSVDSKSLAIKRKKQDGSKDAVATAHAHYVGNTGHQSEDLYMSLHVNSSKAFTTNY
jgi:hypothetical protein